MKTLFNFLLMIPMTLISGYIFSFLRKWFIVRKFGLPELTHMEAIGVLMAIHFPLLSGRTDKLAENFRRENDMKADSASLLSSFFVLFFIYPMIFGISYIWHCVIG